MLPIRRFQHHEDHANAAHARYLKARCLLLIGRLDEAERLLAAFDPTLSSAARTSFELVNTGVARRRLRIMAARAAREAGKRHCTSDVHRIARSRGRKCSPDLDVPAARMIVRGKEKSLRLDDVETLLASKARSPMMPAATSFLVLDN